MADSDSKDSIRVQIHDRGDPRLEGVLRLLDKASRPGPIDSVLQSLCEEVARIAPADVVSVYVREEDGDGREWLVMRGNVGFPTTAIGNVRLEVGEGITGFVAECLRPITVAAAAGDSHYKHVPGLGEERYPSFLAVPLLLDGSAAGVLVLQRRDQLAFAPSEVTLATCLGTPFLYALERARARSRANGARGLASRSARLGGTTIAGGTGIGRAEFLAAFDAEMPTQEPAAGDAVTSVLAALARDVEKAHRRVEGKLAPAENDAVRMLMLVLLDRRFLELAATECARSGVGAGLRRVAREYALHAFRTGLADGETGGLLAERASELEDLCLLAADRASARPALHGNAVLVLPERLGALTALAASARRVAAIAVGGTIAADSLGASVARAAGVPVVAGIGGLFAWTFPGDILLVDAERSIVRVHPPEHEIARARTARTNGPTADA